MKPSALCSFAASVRRFGLDFGFLVFMLVFVTGIGLSTGYTIYVLREKAIDEHTQIAAMHARAIEDHLTQSFSIVDQALANVGETDALPPPGQLGRRLEAALLTSPALRSISVLNAHHRIVASSNPLNLGVAIDGGGYLPPHDANDRTLRIGRPWTGRDFSIGSPAGNGTATGDAHQGFIPVLRNVRIGDRPFAIVAAVNPDYFINHYDTRLRPEAGFVEVLRYDGAPLFSTDERFPGEGRHRHAFIERISEVEFGRLTETLRDGTAVLTSFRASRSFPLVVVAHVKYAHALEGWVAESRRLLLVAVPTLFALVLLTTLLFVHLRRTEEQQAEARQREQDRLAATVFRTVDSGVMVADARDRVIAINPAVTHITGYREEDTLGRKWHALVDPLHPREFLAAISETLSRAGSWHGELWHRQRDGERYVAWQSVNLVRNENGETMYKVVAFSDITDRKKAEEAQLRAVMDASPEAVLLVETDGSVSYANRFCERVFGYAPEETAGLTVNDLVPAAQRARHGLHIAAFAMNPHSRPMGSGMELTALRRDGSEFPAEISLSPMTIGGRLVVIASVSDISDRTAAEQKLRAAKEAAEQALERAHLAERRILDISEQTRERIGQELHDDLGQHLTGAAFLSEILFRKLDAVKRNEKEDAAAITRLINDAVAKTRTLAQGLYPVELREAGLRSMVEQLARNVERTCVVECHVVADEGFVVDDPGIAINLFRMAQEAINNAIRHGKAGRIVIRMQRTAEQTILTIEDDGRGLGNVEATEKGGLGMHTMRYRAALIGASLSVADGRSGGARVVIALPLSEKTDVNAIQRPT